MPATAAMLANDVLMTSCARARLFRERPYASNYREAAFDAIFGPLALACWRTEKIDFPI